MPVLDNGMLRKDGSLCLSHLESSTSFTASVTLLRVRVGSNNKRWRKQSLLILMFVMCVGTPTKPHVHSRSIECKHSAAST